MELIKHEVVNISDLKGKTVRLTYGRYDTVTPSIYEGTVSAVDSYHINLVGASKSAGTTSFAWEWFKEIEIVETVTTYTRVQVAIDNPAK